MKVLRLYGYRDEEQFARRMREMQEDEEEEDEEEEKE